MALFDAGDLKVPKLLRIQTGCPFQEHVRVHSVITCDANEIHFSISEKVQHNLSIYDMKGRERLVKQVVYRGEGVFLATAIDERLIGSTRLFGHGDLPFFRLKIEDRAYGFLVEMSVPLCREMEVING